MDTDPKMFIQEFGDMRVLVVSIRRRLFIYGERGQQEPPQVRCLVGGRGAAEERERCINRCKGWQTI